MVLRSKTNRPDGVFPSDARGILHVISPGDRVALINLGCVRNLVDSEVLLGSISSRGAALFDLQDADTVIVNTCAFVADAKQETIDTILGLIDLKRKQKIKCIIVMGCFSQRYAQIFKEEFPEVDHVFGILSLRPQKSFQRTVLTPPSHAYLKICEGCYNQCSFCIIPSIKGSFRSRPILDIVREAKILEERGFRELDIIGQDITAYGVDLYRNKALVRLLRTLIQSTKNIRWFRLLYAFPKHVTRELLTLIANEDRLCKYIDIPFQHINDRILRSMNRHFFKAQTLRLIDQIRCTIPSGTLRTSVIVGYPGETEKEFNELCEFARDVQFDRLGVFVYSPEEGTPAAKISNQIPGKVKQARYNRLMQLQQEVSKRKLKRFVGQELEVLIDEKKAKNIFFGRSQYDAPEVDGIVKVESRKPLSVGDMVKVKVVRSAEYDLQAKY